MIAPQDVPRYDTEIIELCRRNGDAFPLVFGWACFVVRLCREVVPLRAVSDRARNLSGRHFAAVHGLVLRASNLLEAILRLAAERDHGDAVRILARSTSESAIKAMWLCAGDDSHFARYAADGMKSELEFCRRTEANINARGWALPIEERVLAATRDAIHIAGLTPTAIETAKKLPDLASMYEDVGIERLSYVAAHKLGSHATHGTWMEIVVHYLGGTGNGDFDFHTGPVTPDARIIFDIVMTVLESLTRVLTTLHATAMGNGILQHVRSSEQALVESMAVAYPEDFELAAAEFVRQRGIGQDFPA